MNVRDLFSRACAGVVVATVSGVALFGCTAGDTPEVENAPSASDGYRYAPAPAHILPVGSSGPIDIRSDECGVNRVLLDGHYWRTLSFAADGKPWTGHVYAGAGPHFIRIAGTVERRSEDRIAFVSDDGTFAGLSAPSEANEPYFCF